MSLIKCPKCNHEISDTTKKCIHCKTKIKSNNNTFKVNYKLVIPISIIIMFLIISFIASKIVDNRIIYFDEIKDIEENKNNDIEDNTSNNETNLAPTENANKEEESNNKLNNSSNNNTNNNTINKSNNSTTTSNNNNTSNNTQVDNIPKKTIIDAIENKNCPSGYTYRDGILNADMPCERTDIVEGTLIYSCLNNHTLIGDKCEYTFTMNPYEGKCLVTGYVLNGNVCEKKELFDAMIVGLQCPNGYSKYVVDKKDTRCYKTEKSKQIITYSCPSGYILNGNKCEK